MVSCPMTPVRLESVAYRGARWSGDPVWRLDFSKVGKLVDTDSLERWRCHEVLSEGRKVRWTLPIDGGRVIYLRSSEKSVTIWENDKIITIEGDADGVLLDVSRARISGRLFTTCNLDRAVRLAGEGKIDLFSDMTICNGVAFQPFGDISMTKDDWSNLGFTPPAGLRPALDTRGEIKDSSGKYICLPYQDLEMGEVACPSLWDHYVDSCHSGVYFSQMVVEKLVCSGATAGWPGGTMISPHPDFVEGVPYRRAATEINTAGPGMASLASAVWLKGIQYFSFDPLVADRGSEVRIKWRMGGSRVDGVFAEAGKYLEAREMRRTHYVTPHTKAIRVWQNGKGRPEAGPCVLAPSSGGGGGAYTPRPCKLERERLVAKYGKKAVPRNFNRYTESQISRKSEILKRVGEGSWAYVPGGEDGERHIELGYRGQGQAAPLGWRILRQILEVGDIESDPMGDGLYARLVAREEIFSGGYLRRLVRVMTRDGWGFMIKEITTDAEGLRKSLITMAVS